MKFRLIEEKENKNTLDLDEALGLKEDTVKQNGKWVNKGKEGTHGTFKTKKAADAQRKAMFARAGKKRNFGESKNLTESKSDTITTKFDNVFKHEDNKETFEKIEHIIGPSELYGGGILEIKNIELTQTIEIFSDGVNVEYNYVFDALVDGDFDRDNDHPEWIRFKTYSFGGIAEHGYELTAWYDSDGQPDQDLSGVYYVGDEYYLVEAINELLYNNGYEFIMDITDILFDNVDSPEISNEEDLDESLNESRPRTRKEIVVLQGNYGYGWDDLIEYELTGDVDKDAEIYKEIRQDKKDYAENEPQYSHRTIHRFEKIEKVEESIQKDELSDFFDKAKRLGVTTVKELGDLLAQEESKGNTEKEKIDAYADAVELGDDTLSNESLKEDLNKKSLEQEIRKAVREHFKTWDDEDYEDMIGEYLVVEVEDQEDGRTKVEVRAELSYATLDNIADELNKIVQKYDKDAYFDHEDAGIINAFIDKNAQGKVIDEYGASKDEKLQSVRLRDYRNTWSAIDHMEVNGVDYYMFENDIFGDETYYVVTTNINNGPFYETFDDIETCLRDEGILEESLTEGVNKKSLKKEVKDWARDDYENGVVLDIDDTAEFEKLLLDDHPDLKNRKDMPDLIYELKDLYFDTVDDLRSGDYDELDEKLIQGKSDATLKKNIKTEIEAGKDPKQAYAIAKSIQKKNESFEDEHLGEAIKDDEIVDYFDNSVHDEDIVEDDFDEEHIEELTKKAIEESKKHTKEVGTTITENKAISTPTQEIINESVNSNEEDVVMDYVSPNAVDPNMKPVKVDLNNI